MSMAIGVAARMVVREHQPRRLMPERRFHHAAGIHRRLVYGAFLQHLHTVAEQPVRGIQVRDGEHLVPEGADPHPPEAAAR